MSEAIQITFIICGTLIACVGMIIMNLRHNESNVVIHCKTPTYARPPIPGISLEKNLKSTENKLDELRKKATEKPFYQSDLSKRIKEFNEAVFKYNDSNVPYEKRKEVNGIEILEQSNFIKGYSKEPLKKNKNIRIQKKWNKKYGFKPIPDPQIYFINNKIMGHPETIRKMLKAIPDL